MSGRAPVWVRAALGRLLPPAYRDDVLADLEADARRRFGDGGGLRAASWWAAQLVSPSMLALWWTLRRRGTRMAGGSGAGWWSVLWADVRQAARGLRRSPLFTLWAVLSLALGIGANAAIFGVVDAVLVRPPAYTEPDHLVFIWNELEGFEQPRLPLSAIQLVALRQDTAVFDDVAGVWSGTQTLTAGDRPLLVTSGLVTPAFFPVLGVAPALGRGFSAEAADRGEVEVVIGDGFWRRELGADPSVVGRTVRLEGGEAVIVGVLPRDFKLIFPPAVGVPERLDLYTALPLTNPSPTGPRFLRTVARLRPGVSVAAADAAARSAAARLREAHAHMAELGDEFSAVPLHADTVERVRPVLLALLVGVGLFLLLTAANVANLLLARGAARRRELALRACLGASRGRLARLLLVETGLLTAVGTALGLVLGGWGVRLLWSLRPEGIARVERIGLEPRVLVFTVAAAALAGGIAGFAPLLRLRERAPMALLRGRAPTGGGTRVRRLVTALELALSVVLVVGAALTATTFARLRSADLGFDAERVLTFRVGLSLSQFPDDEERARIARRIEEELHALPGVVSAGAGSHIPLADWANWAGPAAPEGTPEAERARYQFDHRSITPGYLEALGAELEAGRTFRSGDVGGSEPVVVIDRALAERAFPGADPVGRTLVPVRYIGGAFVPTPARIIGVIRDIRDHDPATPSGGQLYWPFSQSARWELTYAVRTRGDPTALVDRARAAVAGVHGDVAAADFRPLDHYVRGSMAEARFTSLLAATFSALALLLAAFGLYGVVAYSTARRTRELGLRVALGARPRDLFGGVLAEGLAVAGVGVGVGLVAAGFLTRYLESLLFGVDPLEPLVFGGVGLALLMVAVAATAGPAARATRVDPVRSLQAE